MPRWFHRWSNFDSARSLGEWVFWAVCLAFNTTSAAVVAAAAAYTQWYWEAYGAIGVACAFLFAVIVLPFSALLVGGAAYAAASARNHWKRSPNLFPERKEIPQNGAESLIIIIDEMNARLDKLQENTDEKLSDISHKIGGNIYGDQKSNFDRLSDRIDYETDARKRELSGIHKSIEGIRNGILRAEADVRALRERVSSVFHAQRTLQRYNQNDKDLIELAEKMSDPIFDDDHFRTWSSWAADFTTFQSMLRVMCGTVAPYCQVEAEIFATPVDKYKSRYWTSDFSGMNDDQRHDYKTFRIIYFNYKNIRAKILSKIIDAANVAP